MAGDVVRRLVFIWKKGLRPLPDIRRQLLILNGLPAPASTPADIVTTLNAAVHQALQGDIQAKLASSGMEPAPSTPEALKATIAADIALHAELVKAAGIQPQ